MKLHNIRIYNIILIYIICIYLYICDILWYVLQYMVEGCCSDVRGPFRTQNPPKSQKMVRVKMVHTSGTFFEKKKSSNVKKHFKPMSPYRVKYTESKYDQKIQKLQNMNYGIYRYNKINLWFVSKCSKMFQNVPKYRKHFGIWRVFCIINCYFEYRTRIRCIWLYMGTWFKSVFCVFLRCFQKMSQKCKKNVLRICLICWRILVPKWSPYVAEASLGSIPWDNIQFYIYVYMYNI